jgi:prepilin-type N-terminal cleavage/methylation domain-containing protein
MMFVQKQPAPRRAFTLIELLIVVAIIAILAAIAVPNFLEAQMRSKVSRVHSDQRAIAIAAESYLTDYGKPAPGQLDVPGGSGWREKLMMAITRLTTPIAYIANYPIDPFAGPTPFNPADPNDNRRHYLYFAFSNTDAGAEKTCFGLGYIYAIQSKGPARTNSKFGGLHSHLANKTGFVYDPTNGSRSDGTIIRTNKGISDALGN